MKIILVDAVHAFVDAYGNINQKMHEVLEKFENPKIICTNALIENFNQYNLDTVPYPVFTLSREPSKSDPEYFRILLDEYNIFASECVYFEHNKDAIAAAQEVGITTYHFDSKKNDIDLLEIFLKDNIN